MTPDNNIESDLFEQYFSKKIAPLIDQMNALKTRYRSRFWGTLWTVMFLVCTNILFVLFNTLIYKHPLNIEQLLLVLSVSVLIILWPLWQYKKKTYPDIFGVFFQFYGDWKHSVSTQKNTVTNLEPILPLHNTVQYTHRIIGKYVTTDVTLSDVQYWQKNKKVGRGLYIELTFPQNITDEILLFAKNGFYRKSKRANMNLLNEQIFIPAAAYFNIFSSQPHAPKNLLCSPFFEKILNIRDIFRARKIYVSVQKEKVIIYLEDSHIYFAQTGIWQRKIDGKNFKLLHRKINEVLEFVELIQEICVRDE